MGTYVQKDGKAHPVPGGVPAGTLERIENDIAELRSLRASLERYGMAMISESEAVTDADSGLVLSAKEKNATVEGTMANSIEKLVNKTEHIINKTVITLTNVDITTRSGRGAYYSADHVPFSDYGIDGSKVISVSIRTWSGAVSLFNIYYNDQGFQFAYDVGQVVYNVTVGVCYKS